MAASASEKSASEPLPPMFAKDRHLLGWQGFTATLPSNWNPAKFGGNHDKGDLRVDDEEGPRLEMRWELSPNEPNIQKSVDDFLKRLEKDAKKRKVAFELLPEVRLLGKNRKRKNQITNFAWSSDPKELASSGFGVAWHCPTCKRVLFAHVMGRKNEKPARMEKLAAEIMASMECHGEGGWETWSTFELKVEIPEEFSLSRAQLLLNQLQLEWTRPIPQGPRGWGKRPERIVVRRFPVANVVLANLSLEDWTAAKIIAEHKQLSFGKPEAITIRGHEALRYQGRTKDIKMRLLLMIFDKIRRKPTPPAQLRIWNCPDSNRLYLLETELSEQNAHVAGDVLDALQCH